MAAYVLLHGAGGTGASWGLVRTRLEAAGQSVLTPDLPLAFQRRVARERLGLDPVVLPGGHLAVLSQPDAVAQLLLGSA